MHVAVTGASSGIGEAIAREFAKAGASVTLVARRRARLDEIARELGAPSLIVAHDLADPRRAAGWLPEAEAALGPIDVLVSNAEFLTLGPVATFDPEEGERMIAVNLLSPARLMRAVLPGMLERRRGVIVNVTSLAALVALPDWIYQAAGKTGSATFSEALRVELRGSGVHVMTVYPGMTDTPMAQAGLDAYGRDGIARLVPLGNSAKLARRVLRGVERRVKRIVYPRFYAPLRWFPRLAGWMSPIVTPRLPVAPTPAVSAHPRP